jgi:hypothetical protein
MARVYSSTSVATTLATTLTNIATSMTVTAGGGAPLIQGAGFANGDIFTIAIDPDTQTEEICYVTANSGDIFTIQRAQAGSSAVAHASGATVRHVLTSADLVFFRDGVTTANAAIPASTLTTKGDLLSRTTATLQRLPVGSNGQVLIADSTATLGLNWAASPTGLPSQAGNSGKYLTTDGSAASWATVSGGVTTNVVLTAPLEKFNVVGTAPTGALNIDIKTAGVWYYTPNATADFTLNFRGDSSTTLNSILATGEAITVSVIWSNGAGPYTGTYPYFPTAITVDGSSITPKWNGGVPIYSGNVSATSNVSYTIIKTASATFTVLATQSGGYK